MHKDFVNAVLAGIITPGQHYILGEDKNRGLKPEPIEYLFLISTESELRTSLDMMFRIMLIEDFRFVGYKGFEKINDDTTEFTCIWYAIDDKRNEEFKMYLQRMITFEEKRRDIARTFKKKIV